MSQEKNRILIEAQQLAVHYGKKTILHELNITIQEGGVTALVGTNGSGKSTLLKALARMLKPQVGAIYLDGAAISTLSTKEVAKKLAVLPQSPDIPAGLTVRELVEQGRYPHSGPLRMLKRQDHDAIHEALALTSMNDFQNRALDTLSGGERQRAWIALALAQATPILMLDEPTTFLDVRHQLEILELVRHLQAKKGMTIIVVLHDLNQAIRYADRMLVLKKGRIAADGIPEQVMTVQLLQDVFGINANLVEDPATGKPAFIPFAIVEE